MAYATINDMINRFGIAEVGQLIDKGGDSLVTAAMLIAAAGDGNISAYTEAEQAAIAAALAVFAQAQSDGDAEIDAYLQGRYPLPLTHIPPVICRMACDLYRYYLYVPRATEDVEKRYKRVVSFLESVSAGKVNLGIAADAQPATTAEPIRMRANDREFTADRLKRY